MEFYISGIKRPEGYMIGYNSTLVSINTIASHLDMFTDDIKKTLIEQFNATIEEINISKPMNYVAYFKNIQDAEDAAEWLNALLLAIKLSS